MSCQNINLAFYQGSQPNLLSLIDCEQKLSVHGTVLEYVRKLCYLGIFLDSEMTLTPLLSYVKKVVSKRAKTLFEIRKYINTFY